MRIAIAHSFYRTPGGEDTYVRRQADLLRRAHDVLMISRDNAALAGGIRSMATAAFSLGEREQVSSELEAFRPDVIHIHNVYPSLGPVVHQTARDLEIPLVMTVHNFRLRCPNGVMFTEGKICRRCETGRYYNAVLHPCFPSKSQSIGYATTLWTHRFLNHLEDSIATFIAPSPFMKKRLTEWGVQPSRIQMARYTTPQMPPGPVVSSGFGAYLGRLSEEKGIDLLLEGLLAAGDPQFRIAGDGPAREHHQDRARYLGLRNTEFVGFLKPKAMGQFLRQARFFVFPSLWEENNPLAAYEAMTAARTILVSDKGGLPELADEGRGAVFRAGDVNELSAALQRLTDDDELCTKMGRLAREFALAEFGEEKHLDELNTIYERTTSLRTD